MAQNYIISTITNTGRDAIQTALTGGYTLTYKHMVVGNGTYTAGEDVRSRTALKSPKTIYPFNSQILDSVGVRLKSVITNADGTTPITQEAYNINEVGIVVTVNGTDYLYAIAAVEGNTGTLLPVYDGINKTEIVQTWYCVNSNDLDVTVTMTGAYALADDMTSARSDITSLSGRIDTIEEDIERRIEEAEEVFEGYNYKWGGEDEVETTFSADGRTITETTDLGDKVTTFNQDGSITESYPDGRVLLTTFNADGSISRRVQLLEDNNEQEVES